MNLTLPPVQHQRLLQITIESIQCQQQLQDDGSRAKAEANRLNSYPRPDDDSRDKAEANRLNSYVPQKTGIASALDWFWGTLKGDFNEDPTMSQIVVGTIITAIPILDQVGDVRDIIANLAQLSDDPDDFWKWGALVLTLIGFIPEVGTVLKGAFKAFVKGAKKGGDAAIKAIQELVSVIRAANKKLGLGYGDPVKYLRDFDWQKLGDSVLKQFKEIMTKMHLKVDDLAAGLSGKFIGRDNREKLKLVSKQLAMLEKKGYDQIPKFMKYLREQVDSLLNKVEPVTVKGTAGSEVVAKNSKADLPLVRAHYEIETKRIQDGVDDMKRAGKSEKEIAEWAVQQRKNEQAITKANTDPEILEMIQKRNKTKYDHPDGPQYKRGDDGLWHYKERNPSTKKLEPKTKTDAEATKTATTSRGHDIDWQKVLEFVQAKKAGDLEKTKKLRDEINKMF
jgi:hypothetical protein